ENTIFERLVAVKQFPGVNLTEPGGSAERLAPMFTTADFFPALGVQPILGRVFNVDEDQPGTSDVAVISYGFWQSHFFFDQSAVGRTLRLDGHNVTILGVMPEGFDYPLLWGRVDLWLPIAFTPQQRQDAGNNYLTEIGRLKPGISMVEADWRMK